MRKLIAKIFKNGHADTNGEEEPTTLEQAQENAEVALENLKTMTRKIKAVDPDNSGPMPVAVG